MSIALAQTLVATLTVYAVVGLIFGLAFVLRGVERVDPAARGASIGFRLLILPGCAALWPYLARRWWRAGSTP